jgi:hypothetical protein
MAELGSEPAFLFMPVWIEGFCGGFGGGERGFCEGARATAGLGNGDRYALSWVGTGSGMLKSFATPWFWTSCTSSPCGSY